MTFEGSPGKCWYRRQRPWLRGAMRMMRRRIKQITFTETSWEQEGYDSIHQNFVDLHFCIQMLRKWLFLQAVCTSFHRHVHVSNGSAWNFLLPMCWHFGVIYIVCNNCFVIWNGWLALFWTQCICHNQEKSEHRNMHTPKSTPHLPGCNGMWLRVPILLYKEVLKHSII